MSGIASSSSALVTLFCAISAAALINWFGLYVLTFIPSAPVLMFSKLSISNTDSCPARFANSKAAGRFFLSVTMFKSMLTMLLLGNLYKPILKFPVANNALCSFAKSAIASSDRSSLVVFLDAIGTTIPPPVYLVPSGLNVAPSSTLSSSAFIC